MDSGKVDAMTHDDIHDLTADTKAALDKTRDALDRLAEKPEAHGHLAEAAQRIKTSIELELIELEKIAEMLGLR